MRKFSLVIVEDDDDERLYMMEAFKGFDGFEVIAEFANGDLLVDWLQAKNRPMGELILSDLNMPGKNGYDIIKEVKGEFPTMPVFIMSTSSLAATQQKCLLLGADGFIPKPDIFTDYDRFAVALYHRLVAAN